jgi:hypothetical protein
MLNKENTRVSAGLEHNGIGPLAGLLKPDHELYNLSYYRSQTCICKRKNFILRSWYVHQKGFPSNNQPDALIIQIYSVIKLYMFRAFSFPVIRRFLLYIWHW